MVLLAEKKIKQNMLQKTKKNWKKASIFSNTTYVHIHNDLHCRKQKET